MIKEVGLSNQGSGGRVLCRPVYSSWHSKSFSLCRLLCNMSGAGSVSSTLLPIKADRGFLDRVDSSLFWFRQHVEPFHQEDDATKASISSGFRSISNVIDSARHKLLKRSAKPQSSCFAKTEVCPLLLFTHPAFFLLLSPPLANAAPLTFSQTVVRDPFESHNHHELESTVHPRCHTSHSSFFCLSAKCRLQNRSSKANTCRLGRVKLKPEKPNQLPCASKKSSVAYRWLYSFWNTILCCTTVCG